MSLAWSSLSSITKISTWNTSAGSPPAAIDKPSPYNFVNIDSDSKSPLIICASVELAAK